MKRVMNTAMFVAIAGLGLSLGACSGQPSTADAKAVATPDQADLTAASIDTGPSADASATEPAPASLAPASTAAK